MVFKLHFVLIYSANSYILSGKVLINIEKTKDIIQELYFTEVPLRISMLISAIYHCRNDL